jgi:hypothetical protein
MKGTNVNFSSVHRISRDVCFTVIFVVSITIATIFFPPMKNLKQEGHDGPEVAHLYIGPQSGVSLNPRAFV